VTHFDRIRALHNLHSTNLREMYKGRRSPGVFRADLAECLRPRVEENQPDVSAPDFYPNLLPLSLEPRKEHAHPQRADL
jgi:hypothetical protein